jgi:hypothetical protein
LRTTKLFTVFAFIFSISIHGFAAKTVTPTTTLSAETGNNTSAADSFRGSSNGNLGAGNVSKVDVRSLLYSGASTGIYAHYMPWFGVSYHMNTGYSETDASQAARQVNDMISRGIQGVIVDWYGKDAAFEDQATETIFNETQKHSGFKFAIMPDAGGLKTADKTGELISDLIYAWQKYMQAPNYMRLNGRPVVFYFGVENSGINWSAVRSQVPGNPIFIFENGAGYTLSYSDGAFGWANGFTGDKSTNWGQAYLADFYTRALSSSKMTFGATWKGFNDSIASWGSGRVLGQQCGQSWLNTFNELNKHYSSGKQLQSLQLVTWNDYEEGTALEVGVENCVSVTASVSGNQLTWKISGNENTVHHYTVFISQDGQNLMPVTQVASGTRALDLGQFGFAGGAYNIYVKAVGQPSMKNHMSGVVGWTSNGSSGGSSSGNPPSGTDLTIAANPTTITLPAGSSASANVVLTPKGNFSVPVTLSCGNLPAGVSCAFDQAVVTPGTSAVTAQLHLKANSSSQSAGLFGATGTFAFWLPGLGFGMVVVGGRKPSRKLWMALVMFAILTLALIPTGCGGGGGKSAFSGSQNPSAASQPGTYKVSIVAQAGSFTRTTTATVNIQ